MGGLDSFVLLTPILMLGVLALLAFVGCDVGVGIQRVECAELRDLTTKPAVGVVFLSWQVRGGSVGNMTVKKATTSGGPYTSIFEYQDSSTTAIPDTYADTDVQNGVRYYYVVSELCGDKRTSTNEAWATPVPPFVTSETLGTIRQDYTGFVGMAVVVGGAPLTIYALGRIVASGNSDTHEVKIVDAATNADVPGSNALVPTAGGSPGDFVYTNLASPVTLNPNASYYVVSRETFGVDQWYNDDTTVMTANVASVTGSVFGDGVSAPPYTIGTASDVNGNYTFGPVNFKYYGFDRGP